MGTHANARLASLRTFNGLGKTLEFTTLEMSQEDILDRVMKNMTEDVYPELFRKKFGSEWFRFEDKWFSNDSRVIHRYKHAKDSFVIRRRDVPPRGGEMLGLQAFHFDDLFKPGKIENV